VDHCSSSRELGARERPTFATKRARGALIDFVAPGVHDGGLLAPELSLELQALLVAELSNELDDVPHTDGAGRRREASGDGPKIEWKRSSISLPLHSKPSALSSPPGSRAQQAARARILAEAGFWTHAELDAAERELLTPSAQA
jgi:hypothetical protein